MGGRSSLVFVAILLLACSSDTRTPIYGNWPAGSYGAGPCNQCYQPKCAAEYAACGRDASCSGYVECVFACPMVAGHPDRADEACTMKCGAADTPAWPDYTACVEQVDLNGDCSEACAPVK